LQIEAIPALQIAIGGGRLDEERKWRRHIKLRKWEPECLPQMRAKGFCPHLR
jgi:hypothetical protein